MTAKGRENAEVIQAIMHHCSAKAFFGQLIRFFSSEPQPIKFDPNLLKKRLIETAHQIPETASASQP
jgi:hypothetical protein